MAAPHHCLICYQTLKSLDGGDPFGGGFSTVSKELNAVFILRKIFEVPVEFLSNYMVITEGCHPSEWIRLCDDGGGRGTCKIMVDKAKRIYKEVLEANRRFRKVKGDIIQLLRRNQRRLVTGGGYRVPRMRVSDLTDKTREFVSGHDYSESLVDPFIGGDCQAEKLLYSCNIVPEIDDDQLLLNIIKEERYEDEDSGENENELDTFYGDDNDNLVENGGDQSSPSTPAEDEDDDKDPLYSGTLNSTKRRGRKDVNLKREREEVGVATTHIPGDTFKTNDDGVDQWHCSCGRAYLSSVQLKRHVKEATMEESCMYSCPLCGKGFRRRWDVKRHLSQTHGEKDTEKVMESVPRKKRKRLDEEDAQETESRVLVSSTAEVSSSSGGHTFEEESQKMEDGTEYWKCSCGKIYLGRESLLKHVKEAVGELDVGRRNWVNCSICGGKFKRRFELNRHMKLKHGLNSRVGTGDKGEEMEVDGREDPEEDGNRITRKSVAFGGTHEQEGLQGTLEDGTEQWKCSCGKLYGSKEAMCRHVKEKNLDPSKWIGCPHCVKSFKRRSELTRHVNGVHGKRKRNECLDDLGTSQDDTLEEAEEDMTEDVENREDAEETLMYLLV